MTNITPAIESLHRAYCRLAGASLALTFDRIYWWECWRAKGWTEQDLALVIKHIQRGVDIGTRHYGALKWSNLIQRLDNFEEELAEAKATVRNRAQPPTPRETVLAQARPIVNAPPALAPDNPRMAGDVAAEWIRKMREAAG